MFKYLIYPDDNILVEMEDPLNYAAYKLSEQLLPNDPIVPVTVGAGDSFVREFVGAKTAIGLDMPRNERTEALLVLDYLLGVPVRTAANLIVNGGGALWGVDYHKATLAPVAMPASTLYPLLPDTGRDMGLDTCLMGDGFGDYRLSDALRERVDALDLDGLDDDVRQSVSNAAGRLSNSGVIRWHNGGNEVAERRMVDRYGDVADRNELETQYAAFNAMLQDGQAEVESGTEMTLTFYVFDPDERDARDVAVFALGGGMLRLEGEARYVRALARRAFDNRVPDDPELALMEGMDFYDGQLVQGVLG